MTFTAHFTPLCHEQSFPHSHLTRPTHDTPAPYRSLHGTAHTQAHQPPTASRQLQHKMRGAGAAPQLLGIGMILFGMVNCFVGFSMLGDRGIQNRQKARDKLGIETTFGTATADSGTSSSPKQS